MSVEQIIADWAQNTHNYQVQVMVKRAIEHSGAGKQSLSERIESIGPDAYKVVFEYLSYLKFTDMGVGKGTSMSDTKTGKRKANRNWYSKALEHRIHTLSEIMLDHFSSKGIEEALKYLPRRVDM